MNSAAGPERLVRLSRGSPDPVSTEPLVGGVAHPRSPGDHLSAPPPDLSREIRMSLTSDEWVCQSDLAPLGAVLMV